MREAGVAVMPGIYFVRLEAEGFADAERDLLLRKAGTDQGHLFAAA